MKMMKKLLLSLFAAASLGFVQAGPDITQADVINAWYGVDGGVNAGTSNSNDPGIKGKSIADVVRIKFIKNGKLDITPEMNSVFGDPVPGTVKVLAVHVRKNGVDAHLRFPEWVGGTWAWGDKVLYDKAANRAGLFPTGGANDAYLNSLNIIMAQSLADLPAGSVVALLSLKDSNNPRALELVDGKYLKAQVPASDVANRTTAQFKVLRSSDKIGFQRMDNNNKLQAVPPGHPAAPSEAGYIVRFENQNFADWEQYTLEFQGDVVFIRSVSTRGYLSNRDEDWSKGGKVFTRDHTGGPAGKGPWEQFRIRILSRP